MAGGIRDLAARKRIGRGRYIFLWSVNYPALSSEASCFNQSTCFSFTRSIGRLSTSLSSGRSDGTFSISFKEMNESASLSSLRRGLLARKS